MTEPQGAGGGVETRVIELLRAISDRGPWIETDIGHGPFEKCQWCAAYWGERFPRDAPSYISQDPHEPDCLWLRLESVIAQLGRP